MELMQQFADLNRRIMKEVILDSMKLKEEGCFTTIHNYIDTDAMILRKGAVSAKKGEQLPLQSARKERAWRIHTRSCLQEPV